MMLTIAAVLVGLSWVQASNPLLQEPMCSKYHFEEMVLERLIKLEMKVEQWLKDSTNDAFQTLEKQIRTMSTETERSEKATEARLKYFEGFLSENFQKVAQRLETGERRVGASVTSLETVLGDALMRCNLTIQERLDEFGKNLSSSAAGRSDPVLFIARDPDDGLVQNSPIVYKIIELNVGNGYDASTGKFTAPVDGVYIFSVQVCGKKSNFTQYQLLVNGAVRSTSHQYDKERDGVCAAVMTPAVLNKGDTVVVQCVSGGSVVHDDNGQFWNMFTGTLVH